jgi:predicted TIM-barrel fold metal-dependent hydrolase
MSDLPPRPDRPWAVDVHAHFFIPGDPLLAQAAEEGRYSGPRTTWTPELAMTFMDAHRIQMQLLSFPMQLPAETARRFNDFAASVVATHPDRFGMLANIPLGDPDPDAAVREIDRAADELNADGFVLVTNYGGRYLGDPSFEPVFAALNQRQASAFIHPVNPAGFDLVSCGRPGPLIEYPIDTARTVVDAIWAGVMSRHPDVNLVLAHAGGVLPVLAPRILDLAPMEWVPDPAEGITYDEVREQLSRLYCDTAIAGTDSALKPLLEMTDRNHIVFGTDYPAAGPSVIDSSLAALGRTQLLTERELFAVATNAIHIVPSLRNRIPTGSADGHGGPRSQLRSHSRPGTRPSRRRETPRAQD